MRAHVDVARSFCKPDAVFVLFVLWPGISDAIIPPTWFCPSLSPPGRTSKETQLRAFALPPVGLYCLCWHHLAAFFLLASYTFCVIFCLYA